MTFFFDRNLSENLTKGLKAFGEDVGHLHDHFEQDCDDSEWLGEVGEKGWFVISKDKNILKNTLEYNQVIKHKIGFFYLKSKELGRCQIIMAIIRNWPLIKEVAEKTSRPFMCRIPPKGKIVRKRDVEKL